MLGARCSLFAPLANKGALVFDDPLNDTTRAAFLLASSCAQSQLVFERSAIVRAE
jgi:hypothetical protein